MTDFRFISKIQAEILRLECPQCGAIFGYLTEDHDLNTVPAYCPDCGYDSDEEVISNEE